jgi:putative flippase GtrA
MELSELPTTSARAAPASVIDALRERVAGLHTLRRFVLVGGTGYVIYQAVLFLMYDLGLVPGLPAKDTSLDLGLFTHDDLRLLITTLVAAELSIVGAFAGHNNWTFRDRSVVPSPSWLRFLKYNAKAVVSTMLIVTGVVNLATVGFGLHHVIAVPLGVGSAFLWNWMWDAQYIWRQVKRPHESG